MDLSILLARKQPMELNNLERPFTMAEIKDVVFRLGGDKAPGLNGFPMHFF